VVHRSKITVLQLRHRRDRAEAIRAADLSCLRSLNRTRRASIRPWPRYLRRSPQ
jgi:hypothetical protein